MNLHPRLEFKFRYRGTGTRRRNSSIQFFTTTTVAGSDDSFGFTGRHYSRTTDTAAEPRPTAPYKTPGKPTLEELQAEWGPFPANAGAYKVSGTTVTLHAVVAKNPNPRAQSKGGNFTKLTFKLDGDTLWLTPMESEVGQIPNPVTSKYVRVE